MDQGSAIVLVAKISAFGTLIASAEYLARPEHLKDDGLMSWAVSSLRQPWLVKPPFGPLLDRALRYPNVLALLLARALLAGAILAAPPEILLRWWLLLPAALVSGLFIVRSSYGQDGSDQMAWIILTALALLSLSPTPPVNAAFLWFIALQSCLGYLQAGVAKITPRGWRDGTYLTGIWYLRSYGHPRLGSMLAARPALAKGLSLGVIGWETLFPLVLVVPLPVAYAILATGVLFHLANAYVMGLNVFLWEFTAPYPAILYCLQARGW